MDIDQIEQGVEALGRMTDEMNAHREAEERLGADRRHLMLALNREGGVSYTRLAAAARINTARVNAEVGKTKAEAGVTGPHPRRHRAPA